MRCTDHRFERGRMKESSKQGRHFVIGKIPISLDHDPFRIYSGLFLLLPDRFETRIDLLYRNSQLYYPSSTPSFIHLRTTYTRSPCMPII
jgi:hypothetical protein